MSFSLRGKPTLAVGRSPVERNLPVKIKLQALLPGKIPPHPIHPVPGKPRKNNPYNKKIPPGIKGARILPATPRHHRLGIATAQ
ncbi:MAG: hypothetical protein WC593_01860 [Methanoregula sp.]